MVFYDFQKLTLNMPLRYPFVLHSTFRPLLSSIRLRLRSYKDCFSRKKVCVIKFFDYFSTVTRNSDWPCDAQHFVFVTYSVVSFYFINPKFQVSCYLVYSWYFPTLQETLCDTVHIEVGFVRPLPAVIKPLFMCVDLSMCSILYN